MESELVNQFGEKIVIHDGMINALPNKTVDIFREKMSIVIETKFRNSCNAELSERFNRLVDLNDTNRVVVFTIKSDNRVSISLSKDYTSFLARMFPNVETLLINSELDRTTETTENVLFLLKNWSSSITTLLLPLSLSNFIESHQSKLIEHINNLTSLKRLNFWDLDLLDPTTLARLEHCIFSSNSKMTKVVPHLGPNCTSLRVYGNVSLKTWTKHNAPLVKNVTNLRLYILKKELLSFICSNFEALQVLYMDFQILNADMIANLARLSNLTQLSLYSLKFDMATLVQSQFLSLNSVKTLLIYDFEIGSSDEFNGKEFCRVLSDIFPNIHKLTIRHKYSSINQSIDKNLKNYFVHLPKRIPYNDPYMYPDFPGRY